MARYAMVIDLNRCIGCHACTLACKMENRTAPGIFWNRVDDREEGEYPAVRRWFLPRLCMHCGTPPCAEACFTGATYRFADGIVRIDEDKCIGCKACMLACPYGIRYFKPDGYFESEPQAKGRPSPRRRIGLVEKCHFCMDRVHYGKQPACVQACPTGARVFGDIEYAEGEVARLVHQEGVWRLLGELDTDPAVYYIGVRPKTEWGLVPAVSTA